MLWIRVFLILALSSGPALADPPLTVDQLEFHGWFGQERHGDPAVAYIPLGTGYLFQTRMTDDGEQVVTDWIAAHPKAKVTVVDRALVTAEGIPPRYFCYVWLQDGDEIFNLSVVRQGVFPAGVMADGVAYLSTLPNIDKTAKDFPRRLVSDAAYEAFFRRAVDAELSARMAHKGIWSDAYRERRQEWGLE